jgi:uncharacterized membrane protein
LLSVIQSINANGKKKMEYFVQFAQFIKLLHLVSAIMMFAGGFGRQFALAQAAKTTDIHQVYALMSLSGRFENLLAIPGSILVFVFGLIIGWLRGWPLLGFLQGAAVNWLLASIILYLAIYPLVIFIFIPRGKQFAQTLDQALAQGQVTADLTAAFNDKLVRVGHSIEIILVVAILYLMVMKPF